MAPFASLRVFLPQRHGGQDALAAQEHALELGEIEAVAQQLDLSVPAAFVEQRPASIDGVADHPAEVSGVVALSLLRPRGGGPVGAEMAEREVRAPHMDGAPLARLLNNRDRDATGSPWLS